jgi:kynureninase
VLTCYQARSGQQFVLAMGAERLREYSLRQLRTLQKYLTEAGATEIVGGDENHGAFLALRIQDAVEFAGKMQREGIVCDARGEWLRLCPDCLTKNVELQCAAEVVSHLLRGSA